MYGTYVADLILKVFKSCSSMVMRYTCVYPFTIKFASVCTCMYVWDKVIDFFTFKQRN